MAFSFRVCGLCVRVKHHDGEGPMLLAVECRQLSPPEDLDCRLQE